MKLESVRAFKAEASARAMAQARDVEAIPQALLEAGEPRMPASVALGVGRRDDGEFVVAIRTTDPQACEGLILEARGEVDVRVVSVAARPMAWPAYLQGKLRPLEPGAQVGRQAEDSVGTLGAFVRDSRAIYALSNAHVFASGGTAPIGAPITQPSRLPGNEIGALDRFVPYSRTAPNLIDAALCRLARTTAVVGFNGAAGGNLRGVRAVAPEDVGRTLTKVGRTTGVTRGRVVAVEIDGLPVAMGPGDLVTFSDQIEISGGPGSDFSAPGDSGSLIVDLDGYGVGLLFAGGADRTGEDFTYANRLSTVLEQLGVSLVLTR